MMITSSGTVASRYLTTFVPRAVAVAASSVSAAATTRCSSFASASPFRPPQHPTTTLSFSSKLLTNTTMNGIITSSTTTSVSSPNHHLLLMTPTRRTFSDHMPRRAFPQYTSFGPEYAMGVRAVLPSFKRSGGDGVSVDRRGKLLLDFIPRNNSGAGFAWSEKIYFSLTVEELGLLVSQLPLNAVELSHPLFGPESSSSNGGEGDDGGVRQLAGDVMEKVLTVVPGEGGTVAFTIDYVKDGVPGQTPPGTEGLPITPMKVVIQAGEFEVFKSIFQTSIPYLLGWNTTMDIASAAAISKGLMGDGGRNNMY